MASFLIRRHRFDSRLSNMRFAVYTMALEQVYCKCLSVLCQFSSQQICQIHLSLGTGTIRQLVPDVPIAFSLTPPHKTKKNKFHVNNELHQAEPIIEFTQQPLRVLCIFPNIKLNLYPFSISKLIYYKQINITSRLGFTLCALAQTSEERFRG